MPLQWAPNHDNEAGFVSVLPNTAGDSAAMVQPIRYPIYVTAADGSVSVKGAAQTEIEMTDVTFAVYTTMRETDLAFGSAESAVSKNATVSLPEPDQVTYNNWNVILMHRPGVDTVLSEDGQRYARVTWHIKIVSAT